VTHPYRKGPRKDGYRPELSTFGVRHVDGWPKLPKSWLRITKAEHAAYAAVWEEFERTGKWTPRAEKIRIFDGSCPDCGKVDTVSITDDASAPILEYICDGEGSCGHAWTVQKRTGRIG
jgi:lysyl-tRNA synthetase class I